MFFKHLPVAFVAIATIAGVLIPFTKAAADVAPRDYIAGVKNCGGNASRSNFTVGSCTSQDWGCVLKLYQTYPSGFNFRTTANHRALNLTVTANRGLVFQRKFDQKFHNSTKYNITYPLTFGTEYAKNISSERQEITVRIGYANVTEVCARFDVYLNSFVPRNNSNTKVGENCTEVNQPCNFANSNCTVSGGKLTCQCTSNAVKDDKKCLKKAQALCWGNECLKNGVCTNGICQCKKGYKENPGKEKCNNGTAISYSVLLLALQQFLVYFNK